MTAATVVRTHFGAFADVHVHRRGDRYGVRVYPAGGREPVHAKDFNGGRALVRAIYHAIDCRRRFDREEGGSR
jgi:hypothetical protein